MWHCIPFLSLYLLMQPVFCFHISWTQPRCPPHSRAKRCICLRSLGIPALLPVGLGAVCASVYPPAQWVSVRQANLLQAPRGFWLPTRCALWARGLIPTVFSVAPVWGPAREVCAHVGQRGTGAWVHLWGLCESKQPAVAGKTWRDA